MRINSFLRIVLSRLEIPFGGFVERKADRRLSGASACATGQPGWGRRGVRRHGGGEIGHEVEREGVLNSFFLIFFLYFFR